ncbi:MAG TPA: VIT1/CCC1 transporter family protein [Blastocatellia bacterium]|nr:VIT1/CCC1 transporter family protein [Blastocatellia bacterium]
MTRRDDPARFRANLQSEIDSAAVYSTLAAIESQPHLAEVYRRLAAAETRHAQVWVEKLRESGYSVREPHPSWRARILRLLARRFGAQLVLPTLAKMEQVSGMMPGPKAKTGDSGAHARLLSTIADVSGEVSGMGGSQLARLEGRHRAIGGNALRAAVLGANDGLVSNLSLVMGVAGASMSPQAILITGLAGLVAGACSMAMGEWLSVQSSRELYQRQIQIEADELAAEPEEEMRELALIYQAKGLSEDEAAAVAASVIADETRALDTLVREELGIDPKNLGGSAWEASITSFFLFAGGAIVPVVPFVFLAGQAAVLVSLIVSAGALFLIGAAITLLTGRSVLSSGARSLLFGLAASALTYGIGRMIGMSISG